MVKPALPRNKQANVTRNERTGRFDYRVRLVRPDGSLFVRAGSAKSEIEARRKRDLAYAEFNRDLGYGKESSKATDAEPTVNLENFMAKAFRRLGSDYAPTTVEAYRHAMENHVIPSLGTTPLTEIRAGKIQDLLDDITERKGVGVASQVRSALVAVMQQAVLPYDVLASNPAKAATIGKRARAESAREKRVIGEQGKRILALSEGNKILEALRNSAIYWPVMLGLKFGLRSGEALGLVWRKVDIESATIHIDQQAQYVKGTPRYVTNPKSAPSIRTLPIPATILGEFRTAKVEAEREGQEWVCLDNDREPWHPKHITRDIKNAMIQAGFDGSDGLDVPTSHDFRSSYLTWMANEANGGSGVKPHVLMALAGHSNIATTMKYYVRASDADLRAAVDSLL